MAEISSTILPASSPAKPVRGEGKARRTQEERRADTRGRLLNAAIDLLARNGYSRFRIADAAGAAGVSRGGQTHYFATKNDLLEAAIEHVFDSTSDTIRLEASKDSGGDILTRAVAQTGEFLRSGVYKVSLNILITAGVDAHLADRVRVIAGRNRRPIERAWIDRLARSGVDPDKAEDVLWLLWSVQRGTISDELICRNTRLPRGLMNFAIELMTDVIGGCSLPSYPTSSSRAAVVPGSAPTDADGA